MSVCRVLGLLAVLGLLSFLIGSIIFQTPSDATLIALVDEHHGDLQKMLQEMAKDNEEIVMPSECQPPILDESLRSKYRQLERSSQAGLFWTLQSVGRDYGDSARFVYAGGDPGFLATWVKGIEYMPLHADSPLDGCLPSLDDATKRPCGLYFRHVWGPWYIFVQVNED
jgi:hypothetical protein